jgi:hypothetical protein
LIALLVLMLVAIAPLSVSTASAQDIQTRVQFLHAGTDTGKIEIHINGDEVADEFEYGDVTDWIDIAPGAARVTITRDRAGFNYVIFDAQYPVPAGNDYYAVITDALVLTGTFDNASAPGDGSRVQFTHGSVDTPAVNVVATTDGTKIATQLGYASTSETAVLPPGTYSFEITLADSGDSLLTADVTIEAGKSYQLVFVGTPGDTEEPLEIQVLSTDLNPNKVDASASPTS